MKALLRGLMAGMTLLVLASPAWALGPVDIEVSAAFWDANQDFNYSEGGSIDHVGDGDVFFTGKVWYGKWSVDAKRLSVDLKEGLFEGSSQAAEFAMVDFRRRLASFSEGNYFAVGLGWHQVDVSYNRLGGSADASGVRLSAELRTSLIGMVQAYGEMGFFPSIGDLSGGPGQMADGVEGYDYELGVLARISPFLKLKIGYRMESLEADPGADNPAAWSSWETSGTFYGLLVRF